MTSTLITCHKQIWNCKVSIFVSPYFQKIPEHGIKMVLSLRFRAKHTGEYKNEGRIEKSVPRIHRLAS